MGFRVTTNGVLFALLSLLEVSNAIAQAPASTQYKVLSGHRFILTLPDSTSTISHVLLEDITPCRAQDYVNPTYACTVDELYGKAPSSPTLYEFDASTPVVPGVPPPVDQPPAAKTVVFNLPSDLLRESRVYRLTYRQAPVTGGAAPSVSSVTIDTSPKVSITPNPQVNGQTQFHLISSLAFISQSEPHRIKMSRDANCPSLTSNGGKTWLPLTIKASTATQGLPILVHRPDPHFDLDPNATDSLDLRSAANDIGNADVCIQAKSLKSSFSVDSSQAAAVLSELLKFQSPLPLPSGSGRCTQEGDASACNFQAYSSSGAPNWTFPQGTKFSSNTIQPTGKADAGFYANVNLVAATGARFAWGLDGKVAEFQSHIGHSSWLITPLSATANVGNNTGSIKGQTYSDSIDWTLPFSYEWDSIRNHPTTLVFVAAPDYSTDIEFDRKNMLADVHFLWTPSKFYKVLQQENDAISGALWKYPNPSAHNLGNELQFQAGVETGGAIVDTTQKATSGSAQITVPAYDIARIVPQIHNLFQWLPAKSTKFGMFTIDETFTGRYLTVTENTVEQYNIPAAGTTPATLGLTLRPRQGWTGYNALITTWAPPFSSNVGLTATYNDGFNAPKFSRINSVTVGVTIMY